MPLAWYLGSISFLSWWNHCWIDPKILKKNSHMSKKSIFLHSWSNAMPKICSAYSLQFLYNQNLCNYTEIYRLYFWTQITLLLVCCHVSPIFFSQIFGYFHLLKFKIPTWNLASDKPGNVWLRYMKQSKSFKIFFGSTKLFRNSFLVLGLWLCNFDHSFFT